MRDILGRRLLLGGALGGLALTASRAQADTTFTNFRFTATGAPTARTMPERLAEIKNVKDFGAVGDGRSDDTAAIQAAFNAAFGSSASPHGASGRYSNSPVFFPVGQYKITSALTLRSVQGGLIFGAGLLTTTIVNATRGGTVIRTNGCAYTCFRDLAIQATGGSGSGSIAFDLDWDNTGSVALNANYFENVAFSGEIGINIGVSGYMGSENVFVNCYFSNCSGQGLVTRNANALDQTIIGGGASVCGTGFKVLTGSIQLIMNVGLADNVNYDIDIQANCVNAILGCRSESTNFINGGAGTFSIISCGHTGRGKFIDNLNGSCLISACQSYNGKIAGNHGPLDIRASDFNTLDPIAVTGAADNGSGSIRLTLTSTAANGYFDTGDQVVVAGVTGTGGLTAAANGTWTIIVIDATHIDLQGASFVGRYTSGGTVRPSDINHLRLYGGPIATEFGRNRRETRTAPYTIPRAFSGTQYDNRGANRQVTLTLPGMNNTDAEKPGTRFGFYVDAAQTLTIQAANNMTIRVAGTLSAANGTVSSNTVGNYIELECIDGAENVDATKWAAKSVVGTWTVT
jgi:hypothetical protein